MSTFQPQQQQQQQQQQPVVYPNPLIKQPSYHHSNGSFGTVFIVLAVIAVLSAVACFLGRLCNRRLIKAQTRPTNNKQPRHNNNKDVLHHPHDQTWVNDLAGARATKDRGDLPNKLEGDIEFGFDARSSSSAQKIKNPSDHHKNMEDNNNIGNTKRSDSGANNSMRPGSRGHVAFERNGDHAKHHGGGERHDYYGGPRASE